ncbi:MAG: T9SS type A sorting domain-containing protein [Bacteroidota bacterium]|nr:T9SS type A sorting domain-containing protein [Bacteroidota bacterium]
MKAFKIFLIICMLSGTATGQNLPACDSLVINCCTFNVPGSDSLILTVTNYSSVLFDYPSFVLFNSNMDTIAIETVNYFGIGNGPQNHYLNIVAPLVLPFTGYLNLYTLFNSTLACSFPFTIPDTSTGMPNETMELPIVLFPNPVTAQGMLYLETGNLEEGKYVLNITSVTGQAIEKFIPIEHKNTSTGIDIKELIPGIYILQIRKDDKLYSRKFLVTDKKDF